MADYNCSGFASCGNPSQQKKRRIICKKCTESLNLCAKKSSETGKICAKKCIFAVKICAKKNVGKQMERTVLNRLINNTRQ